MRKELILKYIEDWEKRGYKNGIPDIAPDRLESLNKVPSYRKIALAILKNDPSFKSLGFTPKKSNVYSALKRIEIKNRNPKKVNQLKLFK